MKTTLAVLILTAAGPILASGSGLETHQQRQMRQDAERYEQYKAHGNRQPLGGYRETLGDPHYRNGQSGTSQRYDVYGNGNQRNSR